MPQPLFVHSDITTPVQIADIVAYSLNWGLRLRRMVEPTRPEMEEFGRLAHSLMYISRKGTRNNYSIIYLDDLRPKSERTTHP